MAAVEKVEVGMTVNAGKETGPPPEPMYLDNWGIPGIDRPRLAEELYGYGFRNVAAIETMLKDPMLFHRLQRCGLFSTVTEDVDGFGRIRRLRMDTAMVNNQKPNPKYVAPHRCVWKVIGTQQSEFGTTSVTERCDVEGHVPMENGPQRRVRSLRSSRVTVKIRGYFDDADDD